MSEYIDKKALLDEICRDNCERSYDGTCHNCRMTETIADFPAADVAPVVHGRWEYDQNATDWGIGGYVCSVCKNKNNNLPCSRVKSVSFFSGAKYCPNCGARMDGETE